MKRVQNYLSKLLVCSLFLLPVLFVYTANAEQTVCWNCTIVGAQVQCMAEYDGYENCGVSSPTTCELSGYGCDVM